MSVPERLPSEQLRTLFLFEHLDDEQLTWLAEHGRVVAYPAGATIYTEGAPASCFFVLLSGTISMSSRVQGGEIELFRSDYYGSYAGAFDAHLSDRGVPQLYAGTGRAVTDCRMFELPAADFGRAVREWFPMATHLLAGFQIQGRAATDTVARHERLVALGSVTAGLTHELNNPVAAVLARARGCETCSPRCGRRSGTSPVANSPPSNSKRSPTWRTRPRSAPRRPDPVAARGVRP